MHRHKAITFNEALQHQQRVEFSTLVKPVGSHCNLDCVYCYYLDKGETIYAKQQPTMSEELLEEYIRQYITGNDAEVITFCWHGGEPLLAGLDFYRKAMALQQKHAKGKQVDNTLQTNGTLITREWCDFWYEHNFLIGLSIDGPRDIHDTFRLNKGGEPTFERIMRGVELLSTYGVEYNTLSTVNQLSEGRGVEVYRFLKSIGSHFMQFLPVVEYTRPVAEGKREVIVAPHSAASHLAPWSVSAQGYGDFMNAIFDCWVTEDVGEYFVQLFDTSLAQWMGITPTLCAFGESCGQAPVVEHNGDVYSCDHFVYPEHHLGNITDSNLREMVGSHRQLDFGLNKRNTLPDECLACNYYFACRGECPKHRFELDASGLYQKNTLCAGYNAFFRHVDPYMRKMSQLLETGRPAMDVMPWARLRLHTLFGGDPIPFSELR